MQGTFVGLGSIASERDEGTRTSETCANITRKLADAVSLTVVRSLEDSNVCERGLVV